MDVIDEVKKDHEMIKELLADVDKAIGEARTEKFQSLVRLLAVHETAEQEIVHPLAKPKHGEMVDERLAEEKHAEETLAEMEKLDPADHQFEAKFSKLRAAVLKHAEHEEEEEHPKIRAEVEQDTLKSLVAVFRAAENTAPTRPHPHSPTSAAGNLMVGPVVAIVDRTRDAVREAMKKLSA
jgi:hemerythrin superfamily protein